jgi:AmiR/NasT family two-component response regulator
MTRNETALRILLADEREDDLRALADVLERLGHDVTPFAVSVPEAVDVIAREDPDLAFVVFDGDDNHGLALLSETVEYASGPVLVTVRSAESSLTIAKAADMGIAGYVDSWEPDDVQAAIEVALRRHREASRLTEPRVC